jgi:hypothetical protein
MGRIIATVVSGEWSVVSKYQTRFGPERDTSENLLQGQTGFGLSAEG